MIKYFLITLMFLTTPIFANDKADESRYNLVRDCIEKEEYELANEILQVKNKKFEVENKIFQAYCIVKIGEMSADNNQKYINEAKAIIKELLNNYPDTGSERHKEMAIWFLKELKGQGSGPLLEISKSMSAISRLLRKNKTGKNPTQHKQEKIVKSLQKLIDMLEKKEKEGQGKCPKCKGKGCKHCQKPQKSESQNKSNKPMENSKLPKGSNSRKLGRDTKRGTKESWAQAKDRERAKVLDVLKERYPNQYKEIIEQYYKSINNKMKRRKRWKKD